ncbi:MAG TPA: Kazal-type serine protease inhibitor domain-containing protein [Caulobacteraceae bacterium]|nr:Kazal-type serine protease inhibitor domain-containing protein [Caulobacteraceae bacterium]
MSLNIGSAAAAAFAGLLLLVSAGPASAIVGHRCGGIAAFPCSRGEYCKLSPRMCHVSDAMGVCQREPRICPQIFQPVCGCNGRTYPNACIAASNGVSVAHTGRCSKG